MINISLNKKCSTDCEKAKVYGSFRNLYPLIVQINKEISALNKICDTNISFSVKINGQFILEVKNA